MKVFFCGLNFLIFLIIKCNFLNKHTEITKKNTQKLNLHSFLNKNNRLHDLIGHFFIKWESCIKYNTLEMFKRGKNHGIIESQCGSNMIWNALSLFSLQGLSQEKKIQSIYIDKERRLDKLFTHSITFLKFSFHFNL